MFTGLIEALGRVVETEKMDGGMRLAFTVPKKFSDVKTGDSIAVNGCCLTALSDPEAMDDGQFIVRADLMPETLRVTTLGDLRVGDPVNLERTLRLSDRLGGHLVQGHVDAIGTVRERKEEGNAIFFKIEAPSSLMRYVIPKGSITVDGISLTVVDEDGSSFRVGIIPHTAAVTTMGVRQPGDHVNLEADVIGKYVERLAAPYAGGQIEREG